MTVGSQAAAPAKPWAQQQLDYERAWRFGTGEGQRVAVIDTGVSKNPRLTVVAGGDYVDKAGDGTTDCDAHGSVVASIIGAKPSAADRTGYAGVAPGAQILSIRQYSAHYRPAAAPVAGRPEVVGYGNVATLASAVVWAADSGASIINISEAACGLAGQPLAKDAVLGAALQYAVDVKDVVVVAAAGNTQPGTECAVQNDPTGAPPRISTVASPAWYDDYVLTVGSVDRNGDPSDFSLAGPWVDVAAPGTEIVSLNPASADPPLVERVGGPSGQQPIQGTSFAAPYVAGTVALVRQHLPTLTARQVMARVEATARAPAGGWNPRVGHGVVDPVAAVTDVLPADVAPAVNRASIPLPALPALAATDTRPRTVAFVGSAAGLGAVLVTYAVLDAVRRSRRHRT